MVGCLRSFLPRGLAAVAALACPSLAAAQFALVADFDDLADGEISGQGSFLAVGSGAEGNFNVAASPAGSGKALVIRDLNGGNVGLINTDINDDAGAGTIFFQFSVDSSDGLGTWFAVDGGAVNQVPGYDGGAIRLGDNALQAKDGPGGGDTFRPLAEPLVAGAIYNVHFAYDLDADAFSVALQSDGDPLFDQQTLFMADDTRGFDFIRPTDEISQFVVTKFDGQNAAVTVDNLYFDPTGANFDNPLFGLSRIPGDANGDGSVTIADFAILRANFGTSGSSFELGDFNEDGSVTIADFAILRANFGTTAAAAEVAQIESWAASVPEPATLGVLAAAGLGLVRRRNGS